MAYRISELTAGTPPYLGSALLEVSVVNGAAPSGYDSRKALLSDIASAVGNDLTLSGTTTLSGFTSGSILFAGTGGVLSQSPHLFFNSIANSLLIGNGSSGGAVSVNTTSTIPFNIEQWTTNLSTSFQFTTYGTGRPQYFMRSADGTKALPTATASGRILTQFSGVGHDGAAFRSGFGAGLRISATEAWTSTAQGSNLQLFAIANGGVAAAVGVHVENSGNVGIKGAIIPQANLHVGGTAGTARVYNLFTDASNGEWALMPSWGITSNVASYGTNKNGTGTTRNIEFLIGGTRKLDYGIATAAVWTFVDKIAVPGGTAPVLTTTSAVTSGAGAGAGTLTNAPAAGNPTKWIPFNDNGTTRYIPAW